MNTHFKKIFVVDDDEMMAAMLADHLLENQYYNVSVFTTGEECLKHLNEEPDVIILDYRLNNTVHNAADGLRILEQIKHYDMNIHVIMLSSQDQYGKALQTIVKGALEYVVKNQESFKRIDHILGNEAN